MHILNEEYNGIRIVSNPEKVIDHQWSTGNFFIEVPISNGLKAIQLIHTENYGCNLTLDQAHALNIGSAKRYIDEKL